MSTSGALQNLTLASIVDAVQHGPRPLPLFLQLAQQEAKGDRVRMGQILKGLRAFQEAERDAPPPLPPVIAKEGRATIRDYGGNGPAAIFVPSLINPSSVLDLDEDNSLMRWLSRQGVQPMLVDWGWPSADESALDLGGHITELLHPMLRQIGKPYHLIGYCLGGTMSIASALIERPLSLTLIATPWHFNGFPDEAREQIGTLWEEAQPSVEALGLLPLEVLQIAFWMLDPQRTIGKYERFANLATGSPAERAFVRLEDWANNGAPLTRAAAREMVDDLFTADVTGSGRWKVGGTTIDPAHLSCPVFEIVSKHDRIVPAATALDRGDRLDLGLGHVGMIVGSRAREAVWEPLASRLSQSQPNW